MTEPLYQLAPKQIDLMACSADELLFGGGVGSGKTFGLVLKALGLNNIGIAAPTYRALIIRKSYEDIETVLAYQRKYYPATCSPPPQWKRQDKHWEWPNGARIEFGYLQTESDLQRYVGNQYDFIGVEEVADTIPSVEWWDILVSRCRTNIPGLKTIVAGTTNPRGKGVPWMMARFAIAPDGKSTKQKIWQDDIEIGGVIVPGQWRTREYIQSLVTDNIFWDQRQMAAYVQSLASMPEHIRTSLLNGRWDAISADDLLIDPVAVMAASKTLLTKERKQYGRRIIGVDPAHKGKDTTVVIHRKLRTMTNLARWNGLNLMQQAYKISEIAKKAEDEDGDRPIINIDYGMGVGIGERLQEIGHPCNIINFASKARDPEKYLNARAEMYGEMAEDFAKSIDIEQGICDYRIPPDAALIQQLGAITIERDSSGRLKLAPKNKIKKEVGRSPDEADAAALTYAVPISPTSTGHGKTTALHHWR